MIELKPCPFCDGKAEFCTGQNGDGTPWRYLACAECEAVGPAVYNFELSKHPIEQIRTSEIEAEWADKWNRRTPDPATARREALEEAAKALEARKTVFMRDAAAVVRALPLDIGGQDG